MFSSFFSRSNEEKLIKAAKKGDVSKVKRLLEEGVDLNASDGDVGTALLWASRHGHVAVVRELLSHEATSMRRSWTALHWASSRGCAKVVRVLLGHKDCDVNALTWERKTALHWATEHGQSDAVRALLRHEACDVSAFGDDGSTALHLACWGWGGHLDVVRALLDHDAGSLDVLTQDGRTALHPASWYGYPEVVLELLARGLDPNLRNKDGYTPLALCLQLHILGWQLHKEHIFWSIVQTVHILMSTGATYDGPPDILLAVDETFSDLAAIVVICVRYWTHK